MAPLLIQALRSRWFAIAIHAGLWVLLILAARSFGNKAPALHDAVPLSAPAQSPAPVAKLEHLFSPKIWTGILADTNAHSLFYTRHFIPDTPKPPPPPTTKKVEITYQGYFETDGSARQSMMKLGDVFVVVPVGGHVSTNWLVHEAGFQSLTLTNTNGQTTLLPLNTKKEIEVPIQ